MQTIKPTREDLENIMYGKTITEGATLFGVSKNTIGKWIKSYNLSHRMIQFKGYPQNLTVRQWQIINGNLLGDGSIHKMGWFSFGQKHTRKEYVQFIHDELLPFSRNLYYKKTKRPKRVDGKISHDHWDGTWLYSCRFQTITWQIFKGLRNKWYPDGIKIVPKDITITPLTCAMWFADDGSNNPKKKSLTIATNSFTKTEVLYLVDLLKELNIKSTAQANNDKHIIAISCRSYFDFVDMIKPHLPLKCLQYKTDTTGASKIRQHWGAGKLSKPIADEIRELYASDLYTQIDLAEKYNVTQVTIGRIINNRIYN